MKMKKKSEMNSIFKSKAFYIIFSIIASIALWMYVAYVENPEITVAVSGVQVETIGEDVLADNDLVVTDISNTTLTLRFRGTRNIITKLDNSSVSVTVDLSQIGSSMSKVAGVYQLPYVVQYPVSINASDVEITDATVDYITVTVEKLVRKEVPVKGTYDGVVAEGYQAEPLEFEPDTVSVSGPESVMSQVDSAWVVVKRNNLNKTIEEEMPFTFIDINGKEIRNSALAAEQEKILVKLPIVMVKDVMLAVNFDDSNSVTSDEVVYTISPASVTLSGDATTLKDINQIVLGTVDLSSFALNTTETFQIPIPNDITNVTGKTSATVTININDMETKQLSAENIQIKDNTDSYNVEIITQSLDVTIRGKEGTLDDITGANIRVVASLEELGNTTGTFSVEAEVFVDGYPKVDAVGEYKITVFVSP